MLLAVKAIDVLRGVWGFVSAWDVGSVRRCAGGCVYKLMHPLAVAVAYGALRQMAGASVAPHPASPRCCVGMREQ